MLNHEIITNNKKRSESPIHTLKKLDREFKTCKLEDTDKVLVQWKKALEDFTDTSVNINISLDQENSNDK